MFNTNTVLRRVKTFYEKNPGSLEALTEGKPGWFHGWGYGIITDEETGHLHQESCAIVEMEDGTVKLFEHLMIQFVDKVDEAAKWDGKKWVPIGEEQS